jgi:hypothetical protein
LPRGITDRILQKLRGKPRGILHPAKAEKNRKREFEKPEGKPFTPSGFYGFVFPGRRTRRNRFITGQDKAHPYAGFQSTLS